MEKNSTKQNQPSDSELNEVKQVVILAAGRSRRMEHLYNGTMN